MTTPETRTDPPASAAEAVAEDPEPPSRGASFTLDVMHEAGDWSFVPESEKAIHAAASALARHPAASALRGAEASLALSDDSNVRALNATYRGKDAPTNVLSFPFDAAASGPAGEGQQYLGDIILAAETLLREAREMSVPPRHHLQHLVIHGLLHLLGFDHIEDGEAERMEAIETEVLAGLGIADPYVPSQADARLHE